MQTLEPGFRDSPDPGHDLAIVFLRVRTAHAVTCEMHRCAVMVLLRASTGAQAWQCTAVTFMCGQHLCSICWHIVYAVACYSACPEAEA